MKKIFLLLCCVQPLLVGMHRAPRPPEQLIELQPFTPDEGSPVCCTLPRDVHSDRDLFVGGNFQIAGNELIDGDLTVLGTFIAGSTTVASPLKIIGTPQQSCILFLDNAMTEKARLCSSTIAGDKGVFISVDNAVTQNFRVNTNGGAIIAAPSSGTALTVTSNTLAPAALFTGNSTTTAPALRLVGNPTSTSTDLVLTVDGTGNVTTTATTLGNFIINGGQSGPLIIGTTDATTLSFITNNLTRLSIDSAGAVTISTPTAGIGLTLSGGGQTITAGNLTVTAGNIILPVANAGGTQGLLELGGTGANHINLYEFGTRNFFATNGALNTTVTGADNVSIGTTANSTLTSANNTIVVGNNSQASGTDSVVVGNSANSTLARTIVLGSKDSTSTGVAPTAGALNTIAIGSASGTLAGANAAGLAAIALGGSGGTFAGASAAGDRSMALGINATANGATSIVMGSASGTLGGSGPRSSNANAIAIGSANGANAAATALNNSAIAVGGADTVFFGAAASGDHSIALGANSIVASSVLAIAIGSSSGSGTGTGPTANNTSGLAIGSANGNNIGALASGVNGIAVGAADGTFSGASASGSRSIALGLNATTAFATSIAVGSASGTAGGTAPTVGGVNSIAIGSARGAQRGSSALGTTALGIGGSDGVFAGAQAGGNRSIAIGVNPISQSDSSVLIGSASGTAGGLGPSTVERTAICIGSAGGTQRAANAGNVSSISIGSSDTLSPGAAASGMRSVGIGLNANTAGTAGVGAIILGAASAAGGLGPVASAGTSIALGSANGAQRGALASAAGTIAIGSSDGTSAGASATLAARCVAIGCGATATAADSIVLGNPNVTAVKVGIGVASPGAKIDIVGVDGTPVITFNQVNTAIGNAPSWLNRATSAVAGTPIHFDASGRLFGFTSSLRYKTNVRTLTTESAVIYNLAPVLYDAREGYGEGLAIPGFIAEDVQGIAPQLTIVNEQNQPENVCYNSLHAFAIKELQNHKQKLREQNSTVSANQATLESLIAATLELQRRLNELLS